MRYRPGRTAQGRRVRKIICSFPRQADSQVFDALYKAGEIELELAPQGNLAERIRAAGAGSAGSFAHRLRHPGWPRARNPPDQRPPYVFELPIQATSR